MRPSPRLALMVAGGELLVHDDVVAVVPPLPLQYGPALTFELAALPFLMAWWWLRRDPLLPPGMPWRARVIAVRAVRAVRVDAPLHVAPAIEIDGERFVARRVDAYDADAWRAALVPVFGDRVTFDDGPRRRWEEGR